MEQLPAELLAQLLDYLEPSDILHVQAVSTRLAKVSRDNALWRYKCFEKSPSAVSREQPTRIPTLIAGPSQSLSGSAGGPYDAEASHENRILQRHEWRSSMSKRARAAASWDCTHATDTTDWYTEYVARHASLSTMWAPHNGSNAPEVRGLAVIAPQKAVGPLEDGSICIWDVRDTSAASIGPGQSLREVSRSSGGLLFTDYGKRGKMSSSKGDKDHSSPSVGECISVDQNQQRAYIAVACVLNEVDLQTFQVVSQNKFAWGITALSQNILPDQPLSVGTTWSLHLHDPRMPSRERETEDYNKRGEEEPEESIAFLPNYSKLNQQLPTDSIFRQSLKRLERQTSASSDITHSAPPRRRRFHRAKLGSYAQCEPGPLSIAHHGKDSILIAGRFPSILCYDRRFFPRLETVIHSGARLSSLAILPFPPVRSANAEASLLACGEYNGRGSLEVYSMPYSTEPRICSTLLPEGEETEQSTERSGGGRFHDPLSYRNRQSASSAKLLSVAAHGARIVFSDAEGGLKWVERDCTSLVRRWNINAYSILDNNNSHRPHSRPSSELTAAVQGDEVVRKIIPMDAGESDRGTRGDGDLLVWTGERVGLVTVRPPGQQSDEADKSTDTDSNSPRIGEVDRAEEYDRVMRRALERQTDEINWMRRLGMRP